MEALQFKLLLWVFLTAFLLMPLVQGKDFHYCSNRNHTVKITEVTVFPDPVFRGKLITYTISAFTDQVIFGGEMVVDISYYSFHIHSEKYNLCDETTCPISSGDFGLSLYQVLPVYAAPVFEVGGLASSNTEVPLSWETHWHITVKLRNGASFCLKDRDLISMDLNPTLF